MKFDEIQALCELTAYYPDNDEWDNDFRTRRGV